MIAISEIERVIAELESAKRYAYSIGSNRGFGMNQAYGVAIRKLKELIPSENDSSRVSGTDQQTEAEQNEEQKDGG